MLICEVNRGGTRGSEYAYVLLGNELVHVSEVGRKVRCEYDSCVYEVLVNADYVYFFSFSRSGYGYVRRCLPGDYEDITSVLDRTKCEGGDIKDVLNTWLRGVRFRIRNPELNRLLNELYSVFVVMVNEVRSYWRSVGGEFGVMGHAARFSEFLSDPRIYYFTGMSIPNDNGRVRSVKALMSLVYENWVAVRIAEALGTRGLIRRGWETDTSSPVTVWFEQGGDASFAILDTMYGPITMWVEFQWDPAIHVFLDAEIIKVNGRLRFIRRPGRRAVRPDVVLVKGVFDRVGSLIQANGVIDLLVECKALPYNEWASDVDEQVMQYLVNFRPRAMALITRYSVPFSVKDGLARRGIKVIDNVTPGGAGVSELMGFVKGVFGG
ncbi:hypothetical protein [Vulcanisaeta thermophila]|uniref:hypothetical protein n=1 Tax=Vulcanisaeta thermophila TaxID=867917 RepID=UPI000852E846|nr:hypothetical protein [Vulcanisaeta thermophila]